MTVGKRSSSKEILMRSFTIKLCLIVGGINLIACSKVVQPPKAAADDSQEPTIVATAPHELEVSYQQPEVVCTSERAQAEAHAPPPTIAMSMVSGTQLYDHRVVQR